MAALLNTFDDWIDAFRAWQKEINLDPKVTEGFSFEAKFGDLRTDEIEFGDYKGQRKWERVTQIPDQRIRDSLQHLIVYQGDTEFASVEQQRFLFETSPSEYDSQALARIMCEEMRHGWQMCYLLVNYFGHGGKIEAQKMLERRAFKNQRLLGSFNQDVRSWLDLYTYTQFIDRDGKYQLLMLSTSSFGPLARSMGPMLKEESFHLGTGNNGLKRIVKAGRLPSRLLQKYFNKWIPTAYDLFGTSNSGTAHWAYVWGLKGRPDEEKNTAEADKQQLNEYARQCYHEEIAGLTETLNKMLPEDQPRIIVPDIKFNRGIGAYAGKPYSVTGELLSEAEYPKHLAEALPSEADLKEVDELCREPGWIAPKA
jgi:benzoyl-CoA 2,3-epoxidase subunit B